MICVSIQLAGITNSNRMHNSRCSDEAIDLCLRAGVVFWQKPDSMISFLSETFEDLGCEVNEFFIHETIPSSLDFVFVLGPKGTLVPLVQRMLKIPSADRPLLVIHHDEQFSNPDLP